MRKQSVALIMPLGALAIFGFPIIGQANTLHATTCSRADVGDAVAASSYGDTVVVPAGTCTWSSTLTITRGIVLTGAGAAQTTLRSGSSGGHMLIYRPDATSVSTNARFEISGFTFDMANTGNGGLWLDNTTNTPISRVLVHDNIFKNQSGSSSSLSVSCLSVGENGDVYGVAYSNTFQNCAIVGRNYGNYAVSWNTTTFTYGNANNFYWEDNTMTGNSVFHYGGHGGRYVARFNTYNFTAGDWQVVWDIHGNQDSGVYATMGCEIYENTLSLARGTTVVDHRGGACLVFQNTVTGTSGSWQIREEYADSISPDTNPQPQHVSNSYYFLNTANGSDRKLSETQDCCNAIAENREFWNYTAAFNGTVGVGAGPVSARPSTCTTGVAYWATDVGEWNSTHPGADGQLYKCTATNMWTLYYRPYSYPHPLRTDSPPNLSTTPPTNLRAVVQ